MITLNEAIRIAKKWNNKYDAYQEYEDTYEFYINDGIERSGGPDNSSIIEKATGKRIQWAIYFLSGEYDPVEVGEPVSLYGEL